MLHFLAPASTPPLPLRCRMRVQSLRLDAAPLAAPGILRLRLTDPAEQRWEVPQWLFDSQLLPGSGAGRRSTDGDDSSGGAAQNPPPLLELDVQQDPFSMVVTRAASEGEGPQLGQGQGGALFNTTGLRLVYKVAGAATATAAAAGLWQLRPAVPY